MATIEVDLSDFSTADLHREIKRRTGIQPWTRAGMAHDLRTAFYARDASRMEMIAAALEEREDQ